MKLNQLKRGFTAIEAILVIGILGIFLLASYPSILNTLETRNLENTTRKVLGALQTARFRAIDTKINHRVRFFQEEGLWWYVLEQEQPSHTWTTPPHFFRESIPSSLVVTINLPDNQCVEYSSIGIVDNFDSTQNTITLQSLKLKSKKQPDLRILQVYGGGSIRNIKETSG